MEDNLDINKEVNKETSDNTTKSNSEVIKESTSEKDINNHNSASKVSINNEIDTPVKPITKPKKRTPHREKAIPRIY